MLHLLHLNNPKDSKASQFWGWLAAKPLPKRSLSNSFNGQVDDHRRDDDKAWDEYELVDFVDGVCVVAKVFEAVADLVGMDVELTTVATFATLWGAVPRYDLILAHSEKASLKWKQTLSFLALKH